MQLFTDSIGRLWMAPSLFLFFLFATPLPPHFLSVSLSLQRERGREGLKDWCLSSSRIPTRNAFWQLPEQQGAAQRCWGNCTWLRHEKVIICCQGRQGVSVRQELIRYWLPPECSLTHSRSDSFHKSWLPQKEGDGGGWGTGERARGEIHKKRKKTPKKWAKNSQAARH